MRNDISYACILDWTGKGIVWYTHINVSHYDDAPDIRVHSDEKAKTRYVHENANHISAENPKQLLRHSESIF